MALLNNLSAYPFILSGIIGLMIGIERERAHPEGAKTIGVRSLVLIALLGTLGAVLNQWILTAGITFFVLTLITLKYVRATQYHEGQTTLGITTELTAAMVYGLGYLVVYRPLLACLLGATVLIILFSRTSLHEFSRKGLQTSEIKAAIIIIVLGLGIYPFLPAHTIDPWGLFNPQKLFLFVLLLSVIQFSGYVAVKVFGDRFGMIFLGFFGGIVSSTAVFLNLPKLYLDNPKAFSPMVAAGIFATIGMLVELFLIVVVVAPELAKHLAWPLGAMVIVGTLSGLFVTTSHEEKQEIMPIISPLDLRSVVKLSVFIIGMFILISVTRQHLGLESTSLVTFIGGLFELHSVTLASAAMYIEKVLTFEEARLFIVLALLGAYLSKFLILGVLARNRLGLMISGYLVLMLVSGVATYHFV